MIRTRDAVSSSLNGGREFGFQAEFEETMIVSLVTHVKARRFEGSLGDILSGTGLGKKNSLVNDTSVPDAGVVKKPESRHIRLDRSCTGASCVVLRYQQLVGSQK